MTRVGHVYPLCRGGSSAPAVMRCSQCASISRWGSVGGEVLVLFNDCAFGFRRYAFERDFCNGDESHEGKFTGREEVGLIRYSGVYRVHRGGDYFCRVQGACANFVWGVDYVYR